MHDLVIKVKAPAKLSVHVHAPVKARYSLLAGHGAVLLGARAPPAYDLCLSVDFLLLVVLLRQFFAIVFITSDF